MDWVCGLVFSLFVGHVLTAILLVCLRRWIEFRAAEWKHFKWRKRASFYLGFTLYPPVDRGERHVPSWLVGPPERLFFTPLVALHVPGYPIAMVTWVAVKMLASRRYRERSTPPLPFEVAGLLGNLLSMFFAFLGGLTIQYEFWTSILAPFLDKIWCSLLR
jgi:hypothetical protein